MRQIKFRGIDIATGEFVYGFLSSNGEDFVIGFHGERYRFDFVEERSVGQFTGLTDKNGVEIYEGDVVRIWGGVEQMGCFEYEEICRIVFNNGSFSPVNKSEIHNDIHMIENIQVIGNIHQNPELLT